MNTKTKGYFEIAIIDEDIMKNACVTEMFYIKDLQQRKMFLNTDIDQESVHEIAKHIMQFNCEDRGVPVEERKPILLYIASNGGEVDSGFELIDIILNSKTPVYTINMGYQYSMGFLIGLSGHKRYALKNAKYLLHDGSNFAYGSTTNVHDQVMFNMKVEERIKKYILERSKLTEEEYDAKLRVEWYMFADEAKEKGFTDFIIGEDCDMDEVI